MAFASFSDVIFVLDHGSVEVRVLVVGEDGVLVGPGINQSFHLEHTSLVCSLGT